MEHSMEHSVCSAAVASECSPTPDVFTGYDCIFPAFILGVRSSRDLLICC